jgi:hypothetical protein
MHPRDPAAAFVELLGDEARERNAGLPHGALPDVLDGLARGRGTGRVPLST